VNTVPLCGKPPRDKPVAGETDGVEWGRPLDGEGARVTYEKPVVVDYGSIADHTFQTPGGVKGCTVNCHLDSFSENSGLPVSA
jgi:hypothetical protein